VKLHILSDLHIEFEAHDHPRPDSDVVILAGGIGTNLSGLRFAQALETPVIYVAGNHEYYGQSLPHLTNKLEVKAQRTSVHFLENREVLIDSVRFLGSTLWTDFALLGNRNVAMGEAESGMNDFRRIRKSPEFHRLRPAEVWRLHRESLSWLEVRLKSPFNGRTVVVTHHAPTARSLGTVLQADSLAPAFASNLEWLISEYEIDLWIHGHTHQSVDHTLFGTRIISNQRGYPDEATEFDPALIIEV